MPKWLCTHRYSWLVGVLACALVCVVFTTPAMAQRRMSERELRQEVYDLVVEGNEAYAEGSFDAALDAYTRAYQIREDPDLIYRIGQTQERLGNFYGARTSLESYLKKVPNTRYRANIEAKIEQLAQREKDAQPKIVVATEPPGALVLLDGAPVSGTTPQTLRVGVGEHTLRVELEGYLPIDETVTLETGQVLRRQIYLERRKADEDDGDDIASEEDLAPDEFPDPSEIVRDRAGARDDGPIVEGAPKKGSDDGEEGPRTVPVIVDITPGAGANILGWGALVVGGAVGVIGIFVRRQNPGVPFRFNPLPGILMGTGAVFIAGGSFVLFRPSQAYKNLPRVPEGDRVTPDGGKELPITGIGYRKLF